ncbi:unnamed protein product [Prunus brigantina]
MELAHGVKKVITATDVGRLVVPRDMLAVLPPVTPGNAISINVLDRPTDRVYVFQLAGRHGRYLKPVLQSLEDGNALSRTKALLLGTKSGSGRRKTQLIKHNTELQCSNQIFFPATQIFMMSRN